MSELVTPPQSEIRESVAIRAILFVQLAVSLVGGALHLGLIWVTARNNKFHNTCNLLIAANSIAAIGAYCIVVAPLCVICLPQLHPSLQQCFFVQLVPLFASFHFFSLMAAIGLDRLLSAFWPVWYFYRNEFLSFAILLLLSLAFPLCIVRLALLNMLDSPNDEKACTLGELIGHQTIDVVLLSLSCILLSIVFYSAVWLRIKYNVRNGIVGATASSQSIFKSLCVILCLQVGGWVLGQLIVLGVYLRAQLFDPLVRWQITLAVLCLLTLLGALEVPVLFNTSREYRECFIREFPWLFRHAQTESATSHNISPPRVATNAAVNVTRVAPAKVQRHLAHRPSVLPSSAMPAI